LKASAATGGALVLGFYLPARPSPIASSPSRATSFAPNAWLEILQGGNVKIWCAHSEMGQGVFTFLPVIVAEELCCDWRRVKVLEADLDPQYGNQITGGSGSIRTSYEKLRKSNGRVKQANFNDYEVLRMGEAPPVIEVHIIKNNERPGGVGEPGVPPTAPAVVNAIFAATGNVSTACPFAPPI
jgi:CO/xanthine dehydrogenase Mo-binding subunit